MDIDLPEFNLRKDSDGYLEFFHDDFLTPTWIRCSIVEVIDKDTLTIKYHCPHLLEDVTEEQHRIY